MNRRGFFRLVAGAALAPVVAKADLFDLAEVPTLWGDGIHNDAPGLNALLRGDVVHFAFPEMAQGSGWFGDSVIMPAGMFRCEDVIRIQQSGIRLIGNGAIIIGDHEKEATVVVELDEDDTKGVALYDLQLESRGAKSVLWFDSIIPARWEISG